jgi:hypothetical protein
VVLYSVAPQSQSGYTYTWNVPFAGTDAVQKDGLGEQWNVYFSGRLIILDISTWQMNYLTVPYCPCHYLVA